MSNSADYVIIGGGIIGLLSARCLVHSGASVVVCDAGYPAASVASAGILSALPPWRADARVNRLIEKSDRRILSLFNELKDVNMRCEWQRLGMLSLDHPTQKTVGNYAQVRALAPHINTDKKFAFYIPHVMYVRSQQLLVGLKVWLHNQGVHFVQGTGKFHYHNDTVDCWQTNGKAITANNYIVCAGAQSGSLCPPPSLPLVPKRGQLLLYHDCPPLCCIVLGEDGLYLLPHRDGSLLVGTSFEDVGFDNRTTAAVIENLQERAIKIIPSLSSAKLVNAWSGLRPCTADGVPIIDVHPHYRNLFLNVGHSRYGLSMAMAAADHLVAVMKKQFENNLYAFYESGNAPHKSQSDNANQQMGYA